MELLVSNYQPLKTEYCKFNEKFFQLLSESETVNIAVGYISERSLEDLAEFIFEHGGPICNLVIGMHYFDRFTYSQYAKAVEIEKFFRDNELGTVKLVTSFPYHGKAYLFKKNNGSIISIIGSSNLDNINIHQPTIRYEFDLLVDDFLINQEINHFLKSLINISPDLSDSELEINHFKETNDLLENLAEVKKIEDNNFFNNIKNKIISKKLIEIPLTTYEKAPKSNINACFGKGRESKNGIIRDRPWYEVELIVTPKKTRELDWYPKMQNNVITVVTDDGYCFKCKTSGDFNKNFRSEGDLKILGKWLKGRLENARCLKAGQPVTNNTLEKYGRKNISLWPTEIKDIWFMDFSSGRNK